MPQQRRQPHPDARLPARACHDNAGSSVQCPTHHLGLPHGHRRATMTPAAARNAPPTVLACHMDTGSSARRSASVVRGMEAHQGRPVCGGGWGWRVCMQGAQCTYSSCPDFQALTLQPSFDLIPHPPTHLFTHLPSHLPVASCTHCIACADSLRGHGGEHTHFGVPAWEVGGRLHPLHRVC